MRTGTILVLLAAGCVNTATKATGDVTITVTILSGKPHAGIYTSNSGALLDDARDAKNSLGTPGATVWIRVDEKNEIVVIGRGQEIQ
ncbi:MAG: hypothetical protein ACYTGV_05670 [Planctomycetota bacterium]|jgi:hypothetical protein